NAWTPTSTIGAPHTGKGHVAVWTGSRMFVWGGFHNFMLSDEPVQCYYTWPPSGGLYDPQSNTWTATSCVGGCPLGRHDGTAVWPGREVLVWGGSNWNATEPEGGGRFNPATNSWQPISTLGAPSRRYGHGAVWTGGTMLVWGAASGGGSYEPQGDTW